MGAFSTESALNYIANDDLTRSPSPTKSPFPDITETPDVVNNEANGAENLALDTNIEEENNESNNNDNGVVNGTKHLDVEETEIAANYAAITAYNGPIRKFNAEIPETINEDE